MAFAPCNILGTLGGGYRCIDYNIFCVPTVLISPAYLETRVETHRFRKDKSLAIVTQVACSKKRSDVLVLSRNGRNECSKVYHLYTKKHCKIRGRPLVRHQLSRHSIHLSSRG